MTPVSVLTGFLGSGKTTILAHLIRQPELADTAVIINEFGDVGLDHDLIESSDETLVTLQTGCLCCRIRGDLVATLHDLLARRAAGSVTPFSRIVIETSGLADPAPILQGLMIDDVLADKIMLARVVTVVDAVNGGATLETQNEARRQVAVADRLVMTKLDIETAPETGKALLRNLRTLNPLAPLADAQHGRLAADVLFPGEDEAASGAGEAAAQFYVAQHGNGGHHSHAQIATFAIVRDEPIAAVALSLFLEALADHCGARLLRVKGIVRISEDPALPAVIHGVQHVFHPPRWLEAWPGADRRSRIVFIVHDISEAWIRALLTTIELEVAELREADVAPNQTQQSPEHDGQQGSTP